MTVEQDTQAGTDACAAAWDGFCDSLRDAGHRLTGPDFPDSPRDRAEGFRYLSRLAVLGLLRNVEFDDPDFPAFLRVMDDVTQWGGPNPDNTYLRAVLRGGEAYRVVGNRGHLHDFIVSVHEGEFPLEQMTIHGEQRAGDLEFADDGSFELIVAPARPEGAANWMLLPADAQGAWINLRLYHYDWSEDLGGWFRIERIGAEGSVPPVVTPDAVAERITKAASFVGDSLTYWRDFFRGAYSRLGRNELSPVGTATGGAYALGYGSGFWDLADGEALLIEMQEPKASYWTMCAYDNERMQVPDWLWRLTSVNGAQAHVDTDGVVRIVVSAIDPGVPNWIDTTGFPTGWLADRYLDVEVAPQRTARVLPVGEVRAALPADHPSLDGAARDKQRAARQQAMHRRFRT